MTVPPTPIPSTSPTELEVLGLYIVQPKMRSIPSTTEVIAARLAPKAQRTTKTVTNHAGSTSQSRASGWRLESTPHAKATTAVHNNSLRNLN